MRYAAASRRRCPTSATSRSATAARSAARSPMPTRRRTCGGVSLPRPRRDDRSSRSAKGERTIPIDGFFKGPFETALAEGELLTAIVRCLTARSGGPGSAYRRFEQPASGYSIVGAAAVVVSPAARSRPRVAIVGDIASGECVEKALIGTDGSARSSSAAHATDGQSRPDIHADRLYRTDGAGTWAADGALLATSAGGSVGGVAAVRGGGAGGSSPAAAAGEGTRPLSAGAPGADPPGAWGSHARFGLSSGCHERHA